MRKALFFVLTALFSAVLWLSPVFAEEEYRYIDAEEAGSEPVPIYKKCNSDGSEYYSHTSSLASNETMDGFIRYMDDENYTVRETGYYITADPSGNYVYITNKYGKKIINDKFKCIYNVYDSGSLRVRYYGANDFSGFATINSDLETEVPMGNYYYLTLNTDRFENYSDNSKKYFGIKRDGNGVIQAASYNNYGDFIITSGSSPLTICYDKYIQDCHKYALADVKAANEAGILPNTLSYKDFMLPVTKGDLISLAVNAVLKKEGTDIFTYIKENNISVDYDKYLDIVSPDVLVAEALDLVKPAEGKYFYPDKALTRQEAAYTLNRLCGIFEVPLTPYSKTFEDDRKISYEVKEAVYNISGTPVLNSYIMTPYILENMFKPDKEYMLEQAIIAVWRISNYESIQESGELGIYNKKSIGGGLYAFQNSDGRWGVWRQSDEKVIVEPLYLPAVSMYRHPDNISDYYINIYESYASNGTFVLTDKNNDSSSSRDNTYYIFNTDGELIKTIHYGTDEIRKDLGDNDSESAYYVSYASGSNLVFAKENSDVRVIKRLVSEIAVTDFSKIMPCGDGEFTAVENSTGKRCILNPDGTLKNYTESED
ncbi:MAG: S-layer homology domain-containing protein [Clostridiales bacterium]|nr:S-layer homology domain-containing protein [Clostridiales bacterium]